MREMAHMLPRIEMLESRVMRLAAAAAASASFSGPIVATEAAASALPGLIEGLEIKVLSHRSRWAKRVGVPGVQGVPPLAAHEVIVSAAPFAGVLARTTYSDPVLRIGINNIFIDPALAASNDENDGLTAATPLRTGYELFRRWGWGASKPIVGCNLATSPDGFITVNVQSNLVTPDSLPIKVTLATNSSFRVRGALLAANIVRTATLTDAVIAMVPGAPLGGVRLTIRDNTLAAWAPFEVPNRRVRFTNGPAVGGTLQPQTDTVAAPGQVQCSACQTTNEPGFSQLPATVTPAVGNTYVVESLVVVNFGELDIDEELNPIFGGFNNFFNIVNCNIPAIGGQFWMPRSASGFSGLFLNFYQCTIDRTIDLSQASSVVFVASYFTGGLFLNSGAGFAVVEGGGMNGLATAGAKRWALFNLGFSPSLDSNFVANGTVLQAIGAVSNAASWNATLVAGVNAAGHGFIIGALGALTGVRGDCVCRGTLWGSTNPGAGLLVSATCNGVGPPQNITGTQGDLKLADDLAAIPLYDTPSFVYARVTDAQVIAVATDVALQAATIGNLVIATPTIALVAGKTYRLVFEARGDTTTAVEVLDFAWVDSATNVELQASSGRGQISNLATNAAESFCVASIIYKPTVNQTVKVRCIASVGAGTTTLRQITGRVRVESLFEFPITASWAAILATVAAGGFGGGAHNPRQKASWVGAEATT